MPNEFDQQMNKNPLMEASPMKTKTPTISVSPRFSLRLTPILAVLVVLVISGQLPAQEQRNDNRRSAEFTLIDVPGATETHAFGVNPLGEIVGFYFDSSFFEHGFLLSNGTFTTIDAPAALLPPPPSNNGTAATGINSQGEIVGSYFDSTGAHGFLLSNGTFTTIDAPGAKTPAGFEFTNPSGINPRGDIVGSYFDSSGNVHGFLLSRGKFTTIDVPGSIYTVASGINPRGDIVGSYLDNIVFGFHGFLLSKGTFTTIDVPGGTPDTTQAFGINPRGDIVGTFGNSNDFTQSWLLSKGTFTAPVTVHDNPPTCECTLLPSGINARGDIVGVYYDLNGVHGFLLSK
jgi:uncharacterized membrane protein